MQNITRRNKYILFLIISLIFVMIVLKCVFFTNSNTLVFSLDEKYSSNAPIIVENEQTIQNNNKLTPLTMTTTRPISIKVGNDIKKIKVSKLSKKNNIKIKIKYKDKTKSYLLKTLPETFPKINVNNKKNKQGYVLISLHGLKLVDPSYSFITDMDGNIIYYRANPQINKSMFHLKKVTLPDGKIRYITHVQDEPSITTAWVSGHHLIMDEQFNVIDKVALKKTKSHDDMLADEHDILMLNDGHYIVIGYKAIETSLSSGKVSQVVHGIIQEQKDGKVLFDWNSENYPQLQGACYEKCPELTSNDADYMHINSLAIDPKDNNLIISSASGYYVMKIHRKTGKILWILGGKLNQFKGLTDNIMFIRQHDAHIISGGRLAIFDNHKSTLSFEDKLYHSFIFDNDDARILILNLDEANKKIVDYKIVPLNFPAPYMGSVQELENGDMFIGCGSSSKCAAEIVDKTGNVSWIMTAKKPYTMYRAYYYETLK